MHWRRKWQPTPVFLPGESQGQGSVVGCRLWGRTESDMTEVTQQQQQQARLFTICKMTMATRQEVLGLYRRIFRLAKKWQAASGQMEDTIKEKQYILNEARTLFQKNKNLTDTDLIKQCIDECTARIEIGLHYQIPYPRPIHLPPMGLTPLRGRGLRSQEKLRKFSKPIYLKSHDEVS
ncbi:LYR motif-containing protein 1 [Bos indicus]|uniref:LYR motif containing 1 n=3 Tax=Bos TaxID=9903 RepID=E1BFE1_BOVIN|nr:LYR motif-containing protein 1 isoform X2 [Bos taurus]